METRPTQIGKINPLQQEFESFMNDLESKLKIFDNIFNYPIDHACYRVSTEQEYKDYLQLLSSLSVIHSSRKHHDRSFNYFLLKEPLVYKDMEVCGIELSEPGGSDNYQKGFQHIEFYTNLNIKEFLGNADEIQKLLFTNKFGDEEYLKWEDKIVVKTTKTPLLAKTIYEGNSKTEVLY